PAVERIARRHASAEVLGGVTGSTVTRTSWPASAASRGNVRCNTPSGPTFDVTTIRVIVSPPHLGKGSSASSAWLLQSTPGKGRAKVQPIVTRRRLGDPLFRAPPLR